MREEVKREVEALGRRPGLATILVGDDPASAVYVRMKREDSAEVGIESFHHEPGGGRGGRGAGRADPLAERRRPRATASCSSSRCPDHLDQDEFISLIDPAKDVDGLTTANAGLLMHGREEAIVPCTPAGVMGLLEEAGVELSGARAVVLGRSILVGKPMAQLLLGAERHRHALPLAHARPAGGVPRGRRAGGGGRVARARDRRHGRARARW